MTTRRELMLGGAAGLAFAACGGARPRGADSAPTCVLTSSDVEGPYYLPDAPRRSSLVGPGAGGTLLVLSGFVRGIRCAPVGGAMLDLWQANQFGQYDRDGYALRGRVLADDDGRYAVTTVVPGRYRSEGRVRPAHIHVKVFAPGYRALTTQVYFQGDPYADGDRYYRPERAVALVDDGEGRKLAEFDFAIAAL